MNFVISHLETIKDISAIIFSATAIVVSILTYIRAKATILAPIRTETVRKQSEILSEMLSYFQSRGLNLEESLDYHGLVTVNVFQSLDGLGFVMNDHEKIKADIAKEIVGGIINTSGAKDLEVIEAFPNSEESNTDSFDKEKKRWEDAKKGNIEINMFSLTRKHAEFSQKLSLYANDPFLPKMIQEKLNKILTDVNSNHAIMIEVIKEFILELIQKNSSPVTPAPFNIAGVFNRFNRRMIRHSEEFFYLKQEIRNYLRVDEKW